MADSDSTYLRRFMASYGTNTRSCGPPPTPIFLSTKRKNRSAKRETQGAIREAQGVALLGFRTKLLLVTCSVPCVPG